MAAIRTSREWLNAGAAVMHRPVSRWPAMNKFVKTGLAILNQDYMGDVNILPPFRISNPLKLMSPLSMREIEALVAMGVKQTWPQIEMIRNQTRISRALASILKDMGGGSPYKRRDLGESSKA